MAPIAPPPERLSVEAFRPSQPVDLADAGISESLVDSLICKHVMKAHSATGREIASTVGLSFSIIAQRLASLKHRRLIASTNVSSLGDFESQLTEEGHRQAQRWFEACTYVGPAPVPLDRYIQAIQKQSIRRLTVQRKVIEETFQRISIRPSLLNRIGAAIHSRNGLFLHGAPGDGKTTIAELIGRCFEQAVWIPRMLVVDGHLIRLFDPAHHEELPLRPQEGLLRRQECDDRWVCIRRPTIVTAGELTLDSLEIRHDQLSNVSEVPFQLKANGGVLIIDDFGRQRIGPAELFNRWILPLDRQYDLLTLYTGKKIQVPFELMIVFSTNLKPKDLCDEAFLRRVPSKIHVPGPDEEEYRQIFQRVVADFGIAYDDDAASQLIQFHYRAPGRTLRRCHPRDLVRLLVSYCDYCGIAREMRIEHLHEIAPEYFISNE
jgi:predicted ATPase with chaperone activity